MESAFLGSGDVLVGEVDGVGVYVERALQTSYGSDAYHLDVQEGSSGDRLLSRDPAWLQVCDASDRIGRRPRTAL